MRQVKTGAVIVAAGLSSRMEAFKPMLPLGNSTIIRTIVFKLMEGGAEAVAMVVGHKAAALREHVSDLAVTCLDNQDYAATDMFRSAGIGLLYMKDKAQRLFFLPGDVPLFEARTLSCMIERMEKTGAPLVIPAYKGRKGHPILLESRIVPALLDYKGGGGLKGAITTLGSAVHIMDVNDEGVLLDADSPEDYRRILRYAEQLKARMRLADR
jgi:CTP:molybdopterin cytidylyltransferase MocA